MLKFSLFKKHTSVAEQPDSELVLQYKLTNNSDYFSELFKRYTRFSFLVCMKYLKNEDDSNEAVMQVFEKLLTDINKYEIQNFKSWLHIVLKNHCLHILRDQSYKLKKEKDLKIESELFMENKEDLYLNVESDNEQMLNQLEVSMEKLSEEQKKCIDLFYLQDKSYEEVANITGYSMNEVKSYLQNGKRNLKLLLTGKK